MSTGSRYGGASARAAAAPTTTAAATSPTTILRHTLAPPPPDTVPATWQTLQGSVKRHPEQRGTAGAKRQVVVRGFRLAAGEARGGRVRAEHAAVVEELGRVHPGGVEDRRARGALPDRARGRHAGAIAPRLDDPPPARGRHHHADRVAPAREAAQVDLRAHPPAAQDLHALAVDVDDGALDASLPGPVQPDREVAPAAAHARARQLDRLVARGAAVAVAEVVLREIGIHVRARVLPGERPDAVAELHDVEALRDVGEPDLPEVAADHRPRDGRVGDGAGGRVRGARVEVGHLLRRARVADVVDADARAEARAGGDRRVVRAVHRAVVRVVEEDARADEAEDVALRQAVRGERRRVGRDGGAVLRQRHLVEDLGRDLRVAVVGDVDDLRVAEVRLAVGPRRARLPQRGVLRPVEQVRVLAVEDRDGRLLPLVLRRRELADHLDLGVRLARLHLARVGDRQSPGADVGEVAALAVLAGRAPVDAEV